MDLCGREPIVKACADAASPIVSYTHCDSMVWYVAYLGYPPKGRKEQSEILGHDQLSVHHVHCHSSWRDGKQDSVNVLVAHWSDSTELPPRLVLGTVSN